MQSLTRPWGTMHVEAEDRPGDRTFVFLNSLGTDLRMWDRALRLLPPAGRAIRMDFRGHGLSATSDRAYGIADLVDDVLAALEANAVERAVVVGCSVGGLVAQRLALQAPERVSALVLSNTAARLGTADAWQERIARIEAQGLAAVSDDILERWFGPRMQARADFGLWRTMLERIPAAGYVDLCRAIAGEDLRAEVGGISVPCLVLAGSEDRATPSEQVRGLAAALPNASFHEFSGAGHLPAIEQPEAFVERLSDFIEGQCNE